MLAIQFVVFFFNENKIRANEPLRWIFIYISSTYIWTTVIWPSFTALEKFIFHVLFYFCFNRNRIAGAQTLEPYNKSHIIGHFFLLLFLYFFLFLCSYSHMCSLLTTCEPIVPVSSLFCIWNETDPKKKSVFHLLVFGTNHQFPFFSFTYCESKIEIRK